MHTQHTDMLGNATIDTTDRATEYRCPVYPAETRTMLFKTSRGSISIFFFSLSFYEQLHYRVR
jgi:hypothetical protein